ncbi:MAG: rod shape-determining protein MreC [Bacteroidia bacterium]
MKNLFLFLWRNNYSILFLLLEIICFYLVIINNNFQNAAVFNSSNRIVGNVMEGVNYLQEYVNLKSTNSSLSRENARLRTLLPEANYESTVIKNNISDSLFQQKYSFFASKVINNSISRQNNYLTLDKGAIQGVKPEMGVISAEGVVGMVKNVSDHYCTVMSVLHSATRISARFKKNNYFGSLSWDGADPQIARLNDIAKHVIFNKGDTIVTTGYSVVFPENIMIGTIDEYKIKPGENFYTIQVKLSVNFRNLDYVYIVDNLLKTEQQQIEAETKKNDR